MYTLHFILQTLFTVYLVIIWLRIILPFVHASYHQPLSQFVIRLTNPVLKPIRRIIPKHQRIDFAAFLLLVVVELIKLYLLYRLFSQLWLPAFAALMLGIGELLQILLMIFFWAIIIQAVLSWLATQRQRYGQLQNVLFHLTDWMIRPIRRIIPPIGMVDLAPIPVMIILYLLYHFIGVYTIGFINV